VLAAPTFLLSPPPPPLSSKPTEVERSLPFFLSTRTFFLFSYDCLPTSIFFLLLPRSSKKHPSLSTFSLLKATDITFSPSLAIDGSFFAWPFSLLSKGSGQRLPLFFLSPYTKKTESFFFLRPPFFSAVFSSPPPPLFSRSCPALLPFSSLWCTVVLWLKSKPTPVRLSFSFPFFFSLPFFFSGAGKATGTWSVLFSFTTFLFPFHDPNLRSAWSGPFFFFFFFPLFLPKKNGTRRNPPPFPFFFCFSSSLLTLSFLLAWSFENRYRLSLFFSPSPFSFPETGNTHLLVLFFFFLGPFVPPPSGVFKPPSPFLFLWLICENEKPAVFFLFLGLRGCGIILSFFYLDVPPPLPQSKTMKWLPFFLLFFLFFSGMKASFSSPPGSTQTFPFFPPP